MTKPTPEDLDVVLLDRTTHRLKGLYFQKIEPLIDDAIRDSYAAVATDGTRQAFIRELTVLNNLVCDLFRHAQPPKRKDPDLSFREIECVILGLKGTPISELTVRECREPVTLEIDSIWRLLRVFNARSRTEIRAALGRLMETARHAPINGE